MGRSTVASTLLLTALFGPPEAAASELRVLTYNVWHGLRPDGGRLRLAGEAGERSERRFAWQIEQLRVIDADLLLLQEVNPNARRARRYARALGMDEIHKVANCGLHLGPLKIPTNVNEGLAILAKPGLGLERVGAERLSGDARCAAAWGFQTGESRFLLMGEIGLGGRRLLVVSTHLSAPPHVPEELLAEIERRRRAGRLDEARAERFVRRLAALRRRHAREVDRLLAALGRKLERYDGLVLGGDFNATPASSAIARIEARFPRAAPAGDAATWDPSRNAANHAIGGRLASRLPSLGDRGLLAALEGAARRPRRIDHVFASPWLEMRDARLAMDRELDGLLASDHFGMLVTFDLDAGEASPRRRGEPSSDGPRSSESSSDRSDARRGAEGGDPVSFRGCAPRHLDLRPDRPRLGLHGAITTHTPRRDRGPVRR